MFANKTTILVINKIDVKRPEDLDPEHQEMLKNLLASGEVTMVQSSCYTDEGVMDVRNTVSFFCYSKSGL